MSEGSLTDAEFGELEDQGLDWVLRHISEQDADIARLKQEIERIRVALEAATKEIERLKEENAHFSWRDKDKNKLISELADALFDMAPDPNDEFFGPFIQRARGATQE